MSCLPLVSRFLSCGWFFFPLSQNMERVGRPTVSIRGSFWENLDVDGFGVLVHFSLCCGSDRL